MLIFPTITISVSSYMNSRMLIDEKVSASISEHMVYLGDNIARELNNWEHITELIYVNHVVNEVLSRENPTDLQFFLDMKKVDEVLNDLALSSNLFSYISSLIVMGNNGEFFLYGQDVHKLDLNKLRTYPWYKFIEGPSGKLYWIGIQKKYTKQKSTDEYVISIARKLYANNTDIGFIYLGIKDSFFQDRYKSAQKTGDGELVIVDHNANIVFHPNAEKLNTNYEFIPELMAEGSADGYKITVQNGQKLMIAYHYIEEYGWWVLETIPYEQLMQGSQRIFQTSSIVFVIAFLGACFLWFFISSSIVRPIKNLTKTIKYMKNENKLVKARIEGSDEIGILSKSYNDMIERIELLIDEVIDEQAKKKDAEYKALQSQISPHFLYNTLNSIRWMALIQKADNICEAIEVLGRLLNNTMKQTKAWIPIREELQNVKDYVYIQKLRYKEKFQVVYEVDERWLDHPCLKFILQPFLENAIFHGIGPKTGHGLIRIGLLPEGDDLIFTLRDNGVGMTAAQIEQIISLSDHAADSQGGIGIRNVHERLRLNYGAQTWVRITSKKDQYTHVEIRFPRQHPSN